MKIGICDDNIKELEQYLLFLNKLGYNNIYVFHSGEKLIEKMPDLDLLFLDIEMDNLSGIQVKNILEEKKKNTYIVFYTTHMETMPEGFGANVLGFLRKPVTLHELELYINKTSRRLEQNYPVPLDNNTYISSDDILYIKSEHNYTLLYKTGGLYIPVRKTLDKWTEELVPHGFVPVHRSYIANMYNINYIEKSSLVLVNGQKLNISRRMAASVKETFESFQLRLFNFIK